MRIEVGFKTMLLAGGVVGLAWALLRLWPIVVILVVALVIAGMLAPSIAWLEAHRIRRGFAIATVFLGILLSATLFVVVTIPSLAKELVALIERFPEAQASAADHLARYKLTAPLAESVRHTSSGPLADKALAVVLRYSGRVLEALAYGATALFLALYLILDRDRMRGLVYSLVPRTFHVRFSRIVVKLETIVGSYARGQLLTSLLMAVFTFVVLTVARVPNALAIAAFAGVADVLPYVGGVLACVPAVAAASSRGLPVTLGVLGALLVYQELESRVIIPRVYGRALRLPPAIVMVAFLVGGALLGIPGALLAPPIAAGIRMVIEELHFDLPGEEIESAEVRARQASIERTFEARAAGETATTAAAIATEMAEARIRSESDGPNSVAEPKPRPAPRSAA